MKVKKGDLVIVTRHKRHSLPSDLVNLENRIGVVIDGRDNNYESPNTIAVAIDGVVRDGYWAQWYSLVARGMCIKDYLFVYGE